jgi:PAS domain S-box-containing protein
MTRRDRQPTLGLFALLLLAMNAATSPLQAQGDQKRVLVLHALRPDGPSLSASDIVYRRTIGDALQGRLDYYSEAMDIARFTDAAYLPALSEFLKRKYHGMRFDLVIANDTTATGFIASYGGDLFPGSPVVFNATRETTRPIPNSTGFWSGFEMKRTIDLALRLQPDTERVFVVSGASAYDAVYARLARAQFKALDGVVEVIFLEPLPLATLTARVSELPGRSIVCFLSMVEDGAGARFLNPDIVERISRAANVPVYSFTGSRLDHGIVGGRLTSAENTAHTTAALALRVLKGEDAGAIPVSHIDTTAYQVDWREMRRWDLREDRLPAGTIISFRTPTAWQVYRWYVVGAFALVGLQSLMIASLVIQRTRRRDTEARNVALLSAVPDMMFLLTTDGVYVDFHAPDQDALFVRSDQFLGRRMRDVLPADVAALFEEQFARLSPGHTPTMIEYGLTMVDEQRQYEARVVPVRDTHVLAIVRDVTERKRAEAALHDARIELMRASRLSALGEFAATIAHEIRQPLTAIIMNARSCLRGIATVPPDLTEVEAGLLDVVEASQRAEEVIQRNRRLFRDHIVETAPLDMNGVVREAVELAAPRLVENDVVLETALADDLPAVSGDRIELQHVLLNLIGNGIDAMDRVDLGSRRMTLSSSVATEGFVQVAVSDNGVGLDGVDVERIFALSYTTKNTGSGVGLSISRSIVEAHGGRLWTQSRPGRGATFIFTVPVRGASAVAVV